MHSDATDRWGHFFMRFHPPRGADVSEREFDLYQHVMTGAYRFHDLLLGRLLQAAGPKTTVLLVSDHGAQPADYRPAGAERLPAGALAEPRRARGVFCLSGPTVERDELVHGATLLDVAPTILTLFGLPCGEDMPGRPLTAALNGPVSVDGIPSWEHGPGRSGLHPPERRGESETAREALEQLTALGYVETPSEADRKLAGFLEVHQRFSTARVHLDAGRPREAIPILEELWAQNPHISLVILYLAQAYQMAGRNEDCRRLVSGLLEREANHPYADYLLGQLQALDGDAESALASLARAEAAERPFPGLKCQIGRVYLQMARHAYAERVFRSAVDLDRDSVPCHYGLALALLAQDRPEAAVDAALTSVSLRHNFPEGHYTLGVALTRCGRQEHAKQAFAKSRALSH